MCSFYLNTCVDFTHLKQKINYLVLLLSFISLDSKNGYSKEQKFERMRNEI